MPVDIDAAVIANTRLSEDYSVLSLAAPEIGVAARPGQFVMIKTVARIGSAAAAPVLDLRNPARRRTATPLGISLLNKRIGAGTSAALRDRAGRADRLPRSARPAVRAGRSAGGGLDGRGGVGLAPFVTLAEALQARGTRTTLFYGARRAAELYYVELFERLGVRAVLTTEDGSRGVKGYVTAPLDAALAATPRPRDVSSCTSAARRR